VAASSSNMAVIAFIARRFAPLPKTRRPTYVDKSEAGKVARDPEAAVVTGPDGPISKRTVTLDAAT